MALQWYFVRVESPRCAVAALTTYQVPLRLSPSPCLLLYLSLYWSYFIYYGKSWNRKMSICKCDFFCHLDAFWQSLGQSLCVITMLTCLRSKSNKTDAKLLTSELTILQIDGLLTLLWQIFIKVVQVTKVFPYQMSKTNSHLQMNIFAISSFAII